MPNSPDIAYYSTTIDFQLAPKTSWLYIPAFHRKEMQRAIDRLGAGKMLIDWDTSVGMEWTVKGEKQKAQILTLLKEFGKLTAPGASK